tara:strand:+ start:67 stop:1830 length:1764 start_codon:yes stop_codon:yes gene_type:complete
VTHTARIIRKAGIATATLFILWTLWYKVNDADFWWHLTAGQVMLSDGWIQTDPFAHTREGLPYLATHGWLSEVILALLWSIGGSTGVILLRISLALTALLSLLLIDTRRVWPNALLVMLSTVLMRSVWQDRPQMWTYTLFALTLILVIEFANSPNERENNRTKNLYKYGALLVLIQWLWSNLHGGASLIMLAPVGALFIQSLLDKRGEAKMIFMVMLGMGIAFFLTPNGIHNLRYVSYLFTDQTAQFIQEWRPPSLRKYLLQLGPLWFITIAVLRSGRHQRLFSWLLLITFGVLAGTAVRHIPLFILTATALIIWQLKHNEHWQSLLTQTESEPQKCIALSLLAATVPILIFLPTSKVLQNAEMVGLGTHEPYATAYEFVETSGLTGNMFNTYDIGGYLLYRGYPDRKVFVDGRNIDYGYNFLSKTLAAAQNADTWNELEEEYQLTHAVVSYLPQEELWENYPYTNHLDANPDWKMVYLDEFAAVYAKNTPENAAVIKNFKYEILTPEHLHKMDIFRHIAGQDQGHAAERDLLRVALQAPQSTTSLLLLAELYDRSDLQEDLRTVLLEAQRRKPNDLLVQEYLDQYL